MDALADILANIRYRLRHEAVSDDLVEWLHERLDSLRFRYRRFRNEFDPEHILFLRRLAALLPKLEQYLSLDSKLQLLLQRDRFLHELATLHADVEGFGEESFSLVSRQLAARLKEVADVLATPNPALQPTATSVACGSLGASRLGGG